METAAASQPALDARKPWAVIQPSQGWSGLGLGELWSNRELLWVLTTRDIKAAQVLGFRARTPLVEGLQSVVEWRRHEKREAARSVGQGPLA